MECKNGSCHSLGFPPIPGGVKLLGKEKEQGYFRTKLCQGNKAPVLQSTRCLNTFEALGLSPFEVNRTDSMCSRTLLNQVLWVKPGAVRMASFFRQDFHRQAPMPLAGFAKAFSMRCGCVSVQNEKQSCSCIGFQF